MTNSFNARAELEVGGKTYEIYRIDALQDKGDIARLPFAMKVLLENLLRNEDGRSVRAADIEAVASWDAKNADAKEIGFMPSRVLLQDYTGVPVVVDLAAMRDAMKDLGGDPDSINPLQPVDLVIDHSVQVDEFGTETALEANAQIEYDRNTERYAFLRWAQNAFDNFRAVPPDTGIVHQINLEFLAPVVGTDEKEGVARAFPDTVVGTDSHTTMINGIGVLGWGVGGIEAEAAMLGQPYSMLIPDVVGFRLSGDLREGATATDLVLVVVQMLREKGVVGKFVEFYGPGLDNLPLADRATLANMAPEYGATCGIFPIDGETLKYMKLTSRPAEQIALVEAYAKAQGMFRETDSPEAVYTDTLELDLGDVVPSISGPKRPQDRIELTDAGATFERELDKMLTEIGGGGGGTAVAPAAVTVRDGTKTYEITHGAVVIAAITSCTNTSNPTVMLGAGLVAKKAAERGLKAKPWVKTSLAPGSMVVTEYLKSAGLTPYLEALGFHNVGYGCTTCIGNSGPLPAHISQAVAEGDLVACSVLSGNRNFEGRVHAEVRMNFLASPPLVVAYAIAGRMDLDITRDPLGEDGDGNPVYLRDIWPTQSELQDVVMNHVKADMFQRSYGDVFRGDLRWQGIPTARGRPVRLGRHVHLHPEGALFRRHEGRARAGRGYRRRALSRASGRFGDDGPHLARRLHQARQSGRAFPGDERRASHGLQLLRLPAREPRGDDARHLLERAPAQPGGAGHRGRLHHLFPDERGHAHLRRGDAVPGGGDPSRRLGRQGVRHGLLARLGRQGVEPARHPRRHRRELRAHPPLEPGGDGRAAAPVQTGRLGGEPGAHGAGDLRHRGGRRGRSQRGARHSHAGGRRRACRL